MWCTFVALGDPFSSTTAFWWSLNWSLKKFNCIYSPGPWCHICLHIYKETIYKHCYCWRDPDCIGLYHWSGIYLKITLSVFLKDISRFSLPATCNPGTNITILGRLISPQYFQNAWFCMATNIFSLFHTVSWPINEILHHFEVATLNLSSTNALQYGQD